MSKEDRRGDERTGEKLDEMRGEKREEESKVQDTF